MSAKNSKKANELIKTYLSKHKMVLIIVAVVIVLLIAGIAIISIGSGETTFDVKTALKEVALTEQLSTVEYTYNSIVEVKNAKETEYNVSYKGKVKAGFDFDKIDIKTDDTKKVYTIIIPKIIVTSTNVDEGSLNFIFAKKKYDTESTYAKAYNACCKDLEKKAENNKSLRIMAKDNAIESIKALVKPFESQLPEGYTFAYKYAEDTPKEVKS